MITAADTNIFLDLLIPESQHFAFSCNLLNQAYESGSMIICEVVYAELAANFPSPSEFRQFLQDTGVKLLSSSKEALETAAERWSAYTKKRGSLLQCSACGYEDNYFCPQCKSTLTSRQHLVSDFIIGAHALHNADVFLTRDRGYYKKYFPELKLEFS